MSSVNPERAPESTGKDVANCDEIEKTGPQSSDEKLGQVKQFSPAEIQGRFDLLRDLSNDEMEKLNKSVVRKIDWRMMPTITMMFLMR